MQAENKQTNKEQITAISTERKVINQPMNKRANVPMAVSGLNERWLNLGFAWKLVK